MNVADDSPRIAEGKKSNVLDFLLEKKTRRRRHIDRQIAKQIIEYRYIMARQIMKRAYIPADGSEVRARGIHIVHPAEFAAVEVDLQVLYTRIVKENMAHHQYAT